MKRTVLIQTTTVLILVGLGCALGIWLADAGQSFQQGGHDPPPEGNDDHPPDDHEHLHVGLTRQAYENLQLRTAPIRLEDYQQTIPIPGEVIEIPARSSRSIAAPTTAVVHEIHVEAGQVVAPDALLVDLEITDEQLIAGQVALLDLVTQMTVTDRELGRLGPLAKSGVVAGRQEIELRYKRQQLQAMLDARVQELKVRGLTSEQVDHIKTNGQLVQRVVVRLPGSGPDPSREFIGTSPTGEEPDSPPVVSTPPASTAAAAGGYTVERLSIHRGMSVERGDELCRLLDHRWLYIRGEAFEKDIASIAQLNERGWTVTAEFGHRHESNHQSVHRQEGLKLLYVDNHVDPATRTFRFYLRLPNEIAQEHAARPGVRFREWRYKPGQLAHLFVPVQAWTQQIKLPLDAIVKAGLDAFVFRLHEEHNDMDHKDEAGSHAPEHFAEFEPVAVRLLHQDARHAIVAADGQLKLGDAVALNQAYQLHLAMKMQAGEGSHHHHHDH